MEVRSIAGAQMATDSDVTCDDVSTAVKKGEHWCV